MAKKTYFSPVLLTGNGQIDITKTQEGDIGGGNTDYSDFSAWWNSPDVQENVNPAYADFNVNDPSTYPPGFDINDEESWWVLIE